ncbi:MAG TPA: hypothetical protein VFL36_16325 [Myxococcales bacterium]|nr:hypothetical protein [Myxococcales bacterium]
MSALKAVAVLVALSGCAGVQAVGQGGSVSGHWIGEIDRDGWRQPVALDIESENGAWTGQWRAVREAPRQSIENVAVQGDEVRFETGKLRFVGRVDGSRLSGTVTEKLADAPVGELSAVQAPARDAYASGSEWSAPVIP